MKKILWSKKEIRLIKASRNHWKKDIVAKFEAGDKVGALMRWKSAGVPVKCDERDKKDEGDRPFKKSI